MNVTAVVPPSIEPGPTSPTSVVDVHASQGARREAPACRTLLLVDDEENIVSALRRVLRRDGYRILSARSGGQGLALLAEQAVNVIVSDQRMPEMSGVEFLRRAKAMRPETTRIVLSGYTDLQSVTDAINEGAIYKFLTKPWDDEQLRAQIAEAFRYHELGRENERLAVELRVANDALAAANRALERQVEQRARELFLASRGLDVTQFLLDHLPIGIIGVADDDVIVVANRRAAQILQCRHPGAMLGSTAAECLPAEVATASGGVRGSTTGGASFHCQRLEGAGVVGTLIVLDERPHGQEIARCG